MPELRLGGEVVATAGGVQISSVYKGQNLADTAGAAGSYVDVAILRQLQVRSSGPVPTRPDTDVAQSTL